MTTSEHGGRRRGRIWLWGTVVLILVVAAGFLGGGWYFADQLTAVPEVRPFEADNEVVAASTTELTLRDEGHAAIDGEWGLQLESGGHVVLGPVVERQGDLVTRSFDDVTGAGPMAGDAARIDEYVWTGDPETAHGLAFEDVSIAGELGPLPAWRLDGTDDTWVVFVHGRAATPQESLRFLPLLTDLGYPVLVTSYRGDGSAPAPADGRIAFGLTEWQDVEASVRYAIDEGASDVVVMGVSMGGAATAVFLRESPLESVVAGAILDSPVLSMDALLDLQADLEGVPELVQPPLLAATELWSRWLSDLDTRRLELVDEADSFEVPILLIHGAEDAFVPVEPSDAFVEARPSTTYLRVDAADHVRSWNVDREAYEEAVTAFLDDVAR